MSRRRRAALLSIVAAWALLALPLLGRVARADTGNPAIDSGIAAYNDLEYEQAIPLLEKGLAQKNLSKQEATEGYKYLALSQVALGNDAAARDAFRKLLEINPSYNLPRTENPKAIDIFDDIKASLPSQNVVRLTQTASPVRPKRSQPITVTVAVVDETRTLDHVTIYHRVRGQKSFSSVIALPAGSGRYNATIPGTFVAPPAIEYYVAAEAADGHALAVEGSDTAPMVLAVDKPDDSRPVYARWWFWAGVGGVLIAGAAVGLVLASGGATPSNQDATVTITVNGP